ncbi:uncharacterized protein PFL1_06213 [Pseudozyma flocculosa PF-1]|uniref:Chromo domain-containing protein n=2 Tax=Pseudozyma flocculosa TaxID=84751 RepID=A0A5C3FAC1_9BASI|nr:uncharacterized protein PFL1_06213 [Pseudozyma flocculosa PF-1]EPQ26278.1 hypothetical protein PFL1_06213 [Pseudozyma flocculosa PF-1]SPO40239.1 uncharacterized protein PSFLO_05721 [Pseudozyma flocculosa]
MPVEPLALDSDDSLDQQPPAASSSRSKEQKREEKRKKKERKEKKRKKRELSEHNRSRRENSNTTGGSAGVTEVIDVDDPPEAKEIEEQPRKRLARSKDKSSSPSASKDIAGRSRSPRATAPNDTDHGDDADIDDGGDDGKDQQTSARNEGDRSPGLQHISNLKRLRRDSTTPDPARQSPPTKVARGEDAAVSEDEVEQIVRGNQTGSPSDKTQDRDKGKGKAREESHDSAPGKDPSAAPTTATNASTDGGPAEGASTGAPDPAAAQQSTEGNDPVFDEASDLSSASDSGDSEPAESGVSFYTSSEGSSHDTDEEAGLGNWNAYDKKNWQGDTTHLDEVYNGHYPLRGILRHRKHPRHGYVQYRTLWSGYPIYSTTWEPETMFDDPDTLKEYWQRQGGRPADCPPPPSDWEHPHDSDDTDIAQHRRPRKRAHEALRKRRYEIRRDKFDARKLMASFSQDKRARDLADEARLDKMRRRRNVTLDTLPRRGPNDEDHIRSRQRRAKAELRKKKKWRRGQQGASASGPSAAVSATGRAIGPSAKGIPRSAPTRVAKTRAAEVDDLPVSQVEQKAFRPAPSSTASLPSFRRKPPAQTKPAPPPPPPPPPPPKEKPPPGSYKGAHHQPAKVKVLDNVPIKRRVLPAKSSTLWDDFMAKDDDEPPRPTGGAAAAASLSGTNGSIGRGGAAASQTQPYIHPDRRSFVSGADGAQPSTATVPAAVADDDMGWGSNASPPWLPQPQEPTPASRQLSPPPPPPSHGRPPTATVNKTRNAPTADPRQRNQPSGAWAAPQSPLDRASPSAASPKLPSAPSALSPRNVRFEEAPGRSGWSQSPQPPDAPASAAPPERPVPGKTDPLSAPSTSAGSKGASEPISESSGWANGEAPSAAAWEGSGGWSPPAGVEPARSTTRPAESPTLGGPKWAPERSFGDRYGAAPGRPASNSVDAPRDRAAGPIDLVSTSSRPAATSSAMSTTPPQSSMAPFWHGLAEFTLGKETLRFEAQLSPHHERSTNAAFAVGLDRQAEKLRFDAVFPMPLFREMAYISSRPLAAKASLLEAVGPARDEGMDTLERVSELLRDSDLLAVCRLKQPGDLGYTCLAIFSTHYQPDPDVGAPHGFPPLVGPQLWTVPVRLDIPAAPSQRFFRITRPVSSDLVDYFRAAQSWDQKALSSHDVNRRDIRKAEQLAGRYRLSAELARNIKEGYNLIFSGRRSSSIESRAIFTVVRLLQGGLRENLSQPRDEKLWRGKGNRVNVFIRNVARAEIFDGATASYKFPLAEHLRRLKRVRGCRFFAFGFEPQLRTEEVVELFPLLDRTGGHGIVTLSLSALLCELFKAPLDEPEEGQLPGSQAVTAPSSGLALVADELPEMWLCLLHPWLFSTLRLLEPHLPEVLEALGICPPGQALPPMFEIEEQLEALSRAAGVKRIDASEIASPPFDEPTEASLSDPVKVVRDLDEEIFKTMARMQAQSLESLRFHVYVAAPGEPTRSEAELAGIERMSFQELLEGACKTLSQCPGNP